MTELVEGIARIASVEAFVGRLDELSDRHDVTIQAFDAAMIVDRTHLERAVELADRAFERGENVAHDRGVEILLYAAGRRQIDQALELGVDAGEGSVVVVVDGEGEEAAAADDARDLLADVRSTVGDPDRDRVRAYYDVTDAELDVVDGDLAALVHERVALLPIER